MKIAKHALLSFVAFLVAAAAVVTILSGGASPAYPSSDPIYPSSGLKAPDKIISDGTVYPLKRIDAVPVVAKTPGAEQLPSVGNKETLLKLLRERGLFYDGAHCYNISPAMDFAEDDGGPGPAPSLEASSDAGGETGVYSSTNEQVSGVSEGDIVKTDGQYIYSLSENVLRIVRADGGNLETVSSITLGEGWGAEFYVIGGDRLAVISQRYTAQAIPVPGGYDGAPDKGDVVDDGWWVPQQCFASLSVYDISDRAAPQMVRRVDLEGYTVSTRVIGSTVYLVTNKNLYAVPFYNADSPAIMPFFCDTAAGADEVEPLDWSDIYYLPESNDCSYLLVGAVDIYDDEPFDPRAYLGAGSLVYMNTSAMYVSVTQYKGNGVRTDILRFDADGTGVFYSGSGTVDGSPLSQYSMDEYNGFFRIATTDGNAGTYVTVLDGDMKVAGRTEPLAPGEQMQSMRFIGDMGYIVTFRNTDPLFTVDLSDPYRPAVLGELKIPGFSQYLHPVGEGLLLGIGRDTQELFTRDEFGVETVVGARDVGMKISLFDVRDPFAPKELDVLRIGEGWAEVCGNPKALMCDPSRGLYGFTLNRDYSKGLSALIVRVEGGRLSVATEWNSGSDFSYNGRLLFIGDTLYMSDTTGIYAYDYYTFAKIGGIVF